ncbi:MAG: M48 family metallopeptidase [Novibacillus thermophilus]|jgi:STE24 endopeptidase|uniref:Peptidase M48 n=1 Tax=Novibacillus thermophilus TaxID=1471761 RepID=A0A1U9K4B1_9BACL|nr:M48 family metallopeptidase [Novibacillus thermophilus]AQS54875.1 hypothetical protein B0W44_02905 [Novibacillus thermophilus]
MDNKSVRWFVVLFIVYAIALAVGLFSVQRPVPVPDGWVGTVADPKTFIPEGELEENALFARIRDLLYFLQTPLMWLLVLIGLFAGWFRRAKEWLDRRIKLRIWSGTAFAVAVLTAVELIQLPFHGAYYALSRYSGVSNMSVGFWLTDQLKASLLSVAMSLPVVFLLFFFIRNSPRRWWAWMGLISVPLTLFFVFIQPVVLDPLFNDYTLLRESELKADILALADQAGIPADNVYEVNMSERTNALNAYVTGIGSNARIVLWDTMLEQMSTEEILFTMAHEIGHYQMRHVYWGTFFSIAGTFLSLYLVFRGSRWLLAKFGWLWDIPSLSRVTALPVLLLVFSVVHFVATPVNTGISRVMETSADEYALQMTGAPEAGISGFQQLARKGRSETYPPRFIRWWRYTHPSISERLHRFESERGSGSALE